MPTATSMRTPPTRALFRGLLLLVIVALCALCVCAQSQGSAAASHAELPKQTARQRKFPVKGKRTAAAASAIKPAVDPLYSGMTRGKWMDEGERMRGTLTQWEESASYRFYDNATLRIRLDELNSTMQPALIRMFGQSPEAQAVHEVAVQSLTHLQDYAWPLRPFFWAWSDLRAYVRGANVQQLRFSYARTPGAVCQGLQYLAEASNQLTEYATPVVVSAVQTVLHGFAWALCENCWDGCPLECKQVGSSDWLCVLELSPYHAPSLTVTSPAKPFLATTPPVFAYDVTFYTYLSSMYVQNFFVGLALFSSAQTLATSRTVHYFLGAAIGSTFSVVLALYFVARQTKSAPRMIPGVQLFQSVGSMVSFFAPVIIYVMLPKVYKLLCWSMRHSVDFWNADEVLGVPYLGKVYVVSCGLIGCELVWCNQWGATPKRGEKQDEEEIGVLNQDLPLTTSQTALARLLQLMGLLLLFESTSSTESSLLVVGLVLFTRVLKYLATTAYCWHRAAPKQRRRHHHSSTNAMTTHSKLTRPPALRAGDTIAFLAPASGLAAHVPHRLDRAKLLLEGSGYKVKIYTSVTRTPQENVAALVLNQQDSCDPLDPEIYGPQYPCYGSADARTRATDLMDAFLDPDVRAIICTIGGLNCHELLEYLDFEAIQSHPTIFVGFSDITSLHLAFQAKAKMVTFYGPSVLCQLGEFPQALAYTMEHFWKALTQKDEPLGSVFPSLEWTDDKTANWLTRADMAYSNKMKQNAGYQWLRPGAASGSLLGGCLPVLLNVRGSQYMPDLTSCILLLETPEGTQFDRGMSLDDINSVLGALRVDGTFRKIACLVVGRVFAHTEKDIVEIQRLVKYHTRDTTFPILYGVDIGHTDPMLTLPLGCRVTLDSSTSDRCFSVDEHGVI